MKDINSKTLSALRAEIEETLTPLAERHGITIRCGDGSYGSVHATLKLEITVDGAPPREEESFKRNAFAVGLSADDFGRSFTGPNGETYRITGLKTRRPRYPVSATRVRDGKSFKFPAETVRRALQDKVKP